MTEKTIDENIKEAAKEETSAAFKWVPCSERLPSNKHEQCLVNVIMEDAPNKIIISNYVAYYYERGWINAWMPLPDPYREKEPDPDCAWR